MRLIGIKYSIATPFNIKPTMLYTATLFILQKHKKRSLAFLNKKTCIKKCRFEKCSEPDRDIT